MYLFNCHGPMLQNPGICILSTLGGNCKDFTKLQMLGFLRMELWQLKWYQTNITEFVKREVPHDWMPSCPGHACVP